MADPPMTPPPGADPDAIDYHKTHFTRGDGTLLCGRAIPTRTQIERGATFIFTNAPDKVTCATCLGRLDQHRAADALTAEAERLGLYDAPPGADQELSARLREVAGFDGIGACARDHLTVAADRIDALEAALAEAAVTATTIDHHDSIARRIDNIARPLIGDPRRVLATREARP